jgi:hypothetical protein
MEGETVEDISKNVEQTAGLNISDQTVLFRGKILKQNDKLSDLGINAGDTLNIIRGNLKKENSISKSDEDVKDRLRTDMNRKVDSNHKKPPIPNSPFGQSFMNPDQIKDAMNTMNPNSIKDAMKAMDELMDSDFLDEFFGDVSKMVL